MAIIDDAIKASIITRAEMPDSDEDSDNVEDLGEAFVEDFDDVVRRRTFRVGNDGEDDDEGLGSRVASGAVTPAVSLISIM